MVLDRNLIFIEKTVKKYSKSSYLGAFFVSSEQILQLKLL